MNLITVLLKLNRHRNNFNFFRVLYSKAGTFISSYKKPTINPDHVVIARDPDEIFHEACEKIGVRGTIQPAIFYILGVFS